VAEDVVEMSSFEIAAASRTRRDGLIDTAMGALALRSRPYVGAAAVDTTVQRSDCYSTRLAGTAAVAHATTSPRVRDELIGHSA